MVSAVTLLNDGALDLTGYDWVRQQAELHFAEAQAALATIRADKRMRNFPKLKGIRAAGASWLATLEGSDVALQREVLGALITRVDAVRTGWGHYDVQMTWTPLGQTLRHVTTEVLHAA